MPKYRKKPVIIEAEQWHPPKDGGYLSTDVVQPYQGDKGNANICEGCGQLFGFHGWIATLEGHHIVCPGDWIITGVKGEKYPCKPDIFEQTYERVEEI